MTSLSHSLVLPGHRVKVVARTFWCGTREIADHLSTLTIAGLMGAGDEALESC
jgi:hypothetical protein